MTNLVFVDNSQVAALRFCSESEFEIAVDHLYAEQQRFDVTGFNVLLIPLQSVSQAEKILLGAGLKFSTVRVVSTADLTERQRAVLRKERSRAH